MNISDCVFLHNILKRFPPSAPKDVASSFMFAFRAADEEIQPFILKMLDIEKSAKEQAAPIIKAIQEMQEEGKIKEFRLPDGRQELRDEEGATPPLTFVLKKIDREANAAMAAAEKEFEQHDFNPKISEVDKKRILEFINSNLKFYFGESLPTVSVEKINNLLS